MADVAMMMMFQSPRGCSRPMSIPTPSSSNKRRGCEYADDEFDLFDEGDDVTRVYTPPRASSPETKIYPTAIIAPKPQRAFPETGGRSVFYKTDAVLFPSNTTTSTTTTKSSRTTTQLQLQPTSSSSSSSSSSASILHLPQPRSLPLTPSHPPVSHTFPSIPDVFYSTYNPSRPSLDEFIKSHHFCLYDTVVYDAQDMDSFFAAVTIKWKFPRVAVVAMSQLWGDRRGHFNDCLLRDRNVIALHVFLATSFSDSVFGVARSTLFLGAEDRKCEQTASMLRGSVQESVDAAAAVAAVAAKLTGSSRGLVAGAGLLRVSSAHVESLSVAGFVWNMCMRMLNCSTATPPSYLSHVDEHALPLHLRTADEQLAHADLLDTIQQGGPSFLHTVVDKLEGR